MRSADVVLFVDTFTNAISSRRTRDAALRVLRAAGFSRRRRRARAQRTRARPLCCGRTFLAHGLVDEARREAQRMVDALAPHVRARRCDRRARAVVPAVAARRIPGARAWATPPRGSPGARC